MAASVSLSTINGFTKTRYGQLRKSIPRWAIIQRLIKFEERARVGKDFREPLWLRGSQGVTFNAGSNLGTVYTLNAPISPQFEEAVLTPAEIMMREQLAYGAMLAAWSAGETAFGNLLDQIIFGMDEAHRFNVEALMLYGGTSIGTVQTITANTATTLIVQLSAASWAPGIWCQGEKMLIDFYDVVGGTLQNTNAAFEFTSFNDIDNRKILITGNSSDVTTLGTGAQTWVITFRSAGGATAATMTGIDKILTNAGGTLYGINASNYNLLQSSSYAITTSATLSTFHTAATRVVQRGGYGKITFLMNPYVWQDLCDDQSALRRFKDDQKREYVQGAEELTFYGTTGAAMSLIPHPMVKQSEAFGLMLEEWIRGGVSDLTNRLPGAGDDNFFFDIPDKAGAEIRNFSSQFLYCPKPAKQIKVSGIVPRGAPV